MEKLLKCFCKSKFGFTQSLLVIFLITGSISYGNYLPTEKERIDSINNFLDSQKNSNVDNLYNPIEYLGTTLPTTGKYFTIKTTSTTLYYKINEVELSTGNIENNSVSNSINSSSLYYDLSSSAITNQGSASYDLISADFIGNQFSSIHNYGDIATVDSNFVGNTTTRGGAIYNNGLIDSILGTYVGNFSSERGGAIYNDLGKIENINGSFEGNTSVFGGAIFNSFGGIISIISNEEKQTSFTGNIANGLSNAIHNEGTIYLLPTKNYEIVFNDSITGTGTLNIGNSNFTGTTNLNADMTGYLGTVNFFSGTFYIDKDIGTTAIDEENFTNFFSSKVNFKNTSEKLNFNSINSVIDRFNTTNWTFDIGANLNTKIDVDLTSLTGDTFANLNGQTLTFDEINILNPIEIIDEARVVVATRLDENNINALDNLSVLEGLDTVEATDNIYTYLYNVDDSELKSDGTLIFTQNKITEPPVEEEEEETPEEAPEGNVGDKPPAYASHFMNITDRILNKEKETNFGNSIWLDTFTFNEKIKYSTRFGEKKFDNDVYITTAGVDYVYDRIAGYDEMSSIFFGHLRSNQNYADVNLTQEAFYVDTNFELIKNNKYLNFVIVGGRGKVEDKNTSSENFDIYSLSTALKLGATYNLNEKIFIDSSLILGYHNIMSDDYTNASGINIYNENTNIFNFTPEVKVSSNLLGYKPYISLSYNYNYYNGGEIVAKTIALPTVEVKNYVELRVGVDKTFKESVSVYAEVLGTKGDKDSLGAQFGFEWKF